MPAKEQDTNWSDSDVQLAKEMGRFFYDPLGYVLFMFPWGKGRLKGRTLEKWQVKYLTNLGEAVKSNNFDGLMSVEATCFATGSGHGIGKSAISAWLTKWLMSTRPNCKGTVTANSMSQLKSKTWAELRKWNRMSLDGHWFNVLDRHMYHKQAPEDWRCDLQSCKEENAEAFAGQHAIDSSSFYIFDEASKIPPKIWETAQGGMTDGEPFWFVFGNFTRNSGRFVDCFGKDRHRWARYKVDSREVSFTNKVEIAKWVSDYGEDSDFVRVRVKGEQPRMSTLQFIDNETVDNASQKHYDKSTYQHMPKILGVDVAWEGDDHHVIVLRQGLVCRVLGNWQHLPNETATLVHLIAQFEDEHKTDATFVDMHGVGGPVISSLEELGRSPIRVNSRLRPTKPDMYKDKPTELWVAMREWLFSGGAIPDNPQLKKELTEREYLPSNDGMISLEPKPIMKRRGLSSPDIADALAFTFYQPVNLRPHMIGDTWVEREFLDMGKPVNMVETEYDIFGD